ncbi:MAG: hypothetical protein JXP34_28870 [Planctomycetes bacterium]|nr:hypothetical protein [Planctomycetota bacterium]
MAIEEKLAVRPAQDEDDVRVHAQDVIEAIAIPIEHGDEAPPAPAAGPERIAPLGPLPDDVPVAAIEEERLVAVHRAPAQADAHIVARAIDEPPREPQGQTADVPCRRIPREVAEVPMPDLARLEPVRAHGGGSFARRARAEEDARLPDGERIERGPGEAPEPPDLAGPAASPDGDLDDSGARPPRPPRQEDRLLAARCGSRQEGQTAGSRDREIRGLRDPRAARGGQEKLRGAVGIDVAETREVAAGDVERACARRSIEGDDVPLLIASAVEDRDDDLEASIAIDIRAGIRAGPKDRPLARDPALDELLPERNEAAVLPAEDLDVVLEVRQDDELAPPVAIDIEGAERCPTLLEPALEGDTLEPRPVGEEVGDLVRGRRSEAVVRDEAPGIRDGFLGRGSGIARRRGQEGLGRAAEVLPHDRRLRDASAERRARRQGAIAPELEPFAGRCGGAEERREAGREQECAPRETRRLHASLPTRITGCSGPRSSGRPCRSGRGRRGASAPSDARTTRAARR